MKSKYEISSIFKQTFFYSLKVWLIDILIFVAFSLSLSNLNMVKIGEIIRICGLFILVTIPFLILFSWGSYRIVAFTRLNHWIKKIVLSFFALSIILITALIFFGKEDYDGTPIYHIFLGLFSLPTLTAVGIFFPDLLDENLKNSKNTEGVQ